MMDAFDTWMDMVDQTIAAVGRGDAVRLNEHAIEEMRDAWHLYGAQCPCGIVKIGRSRRVAVRVPALRCKACGSGSFALLTSRRAYGRYEEGRVLRGLAGSLAYPHEWFHPTSDVMDAIRAGLPCEQNRWFYRTERTHWCATEDTYVVSASSEADARALALSPAAVFYATDDFQLVAA